MYLAMEEIVIPLSDKQRPHIHEVDLHQAVSLSAHGAMS